MTRRDKSVVLVLIGLLIATSVYAIVTDRGAAATEPAFGGIYVEGVAGRPQFLNPLLATTNVDRDVTRLAFAGLTRSNREGVIVPDLAQNFHIGPEGKVWTFELRPDVYWHDGKEVTADDVVYTVGLVQDPAYAGPYSDAFRGVTVERVDRKTVRFTLPDVFGPFAESTSLPLLPSHILGGVGYAELARHEFNLRPIGTGPFRVAEVNAREVVLTRYEQFHRTRPDRSRPFLDRVILRSYADASEALAALARGQIDGVGGLNSVDAERARSLKNVALYSLPTNDFTAVFLNMAPANSLFRDRAVRQAVATAIDRGRVLQVAADGRGEVADQFLPRGSWAHVADVPVAEYSPDDARARLEDAGWKDSDGDRIRDKGGVALRFSVTTSDEPARIAAAQQVASDLNNVGMRVDVQSVPFTELVDRVARQRAFDLLLVGITTGGDPDPYAFFHSSQTKDPGYNFSGYSTLALDRNLEAARRTYDVAKRKELYASVFTQIATEVPVVFLYFADYLYAQDRSVNGLKIAALTEPTARFWDIEDWYVRTQPRR